MYHHYLVECWPIRTCTNSSQLLRKTGSNIDLEEYIRKVQEGHEQQTPMDGDTKDSPSAPSGTTDPATAASTEEGGGSEINIKTLTFAEIKHLIETGQTHLIPNNKIIPDELNVSLPDAYRDKNSVIQIMCRNLRRAYRLLK